MLHSNLSQVSEESSDLAGHAISNEGTSSGENHPISELQASFNAPCVDTDTKVEECQKDNGENMSELGFLVGELDEVTFQGIGQSVELGIENHSGAVGKCFAVGNGLHK